MAKFKEMLIVCDQCGKHITVMKRYIGRVTKELKEGKPCPCCEKMLTEANIAATVPKD